MAILDAAASAPELLAKQWHLFLAPVLVYAAVWFFQTYLQESEISKIPFAGADLGDEGKRRASYMSNAKNLYLEGYRKFKNGVFRINTARSMTMTSLPYQVLPTDLLSSKPCGCGRPSISERVKGPPRRPYQFFRSYQRGNPDHLDSPVGDGQQV